MGETSSPVAPVTAVAPSQSARRTSIAATASPMTAKASETATHHQPTWAWPPAIRIAAA